MTLLTKSSVKVVVHHILKKILSTNIWDICSPSIVASFAWYRPGHCGAARSDICIRSGQEAVTSQCIILFSFNFHSFCTFFMMMPTFSRVWLLMRGKISPKATSSDICINQAEASLPLTAATWALFHPIPPKNFSYISIFVFRAEIAKKRKEPNFLWDSCNIKALIPTSHANKEARLQRV